MSEEITEQELNEAFEDCKKGDFSVIPLIVGASIDGKPELLEKLAEIIASTVNPNNFSEYEKEIEGFILAGFDNNKIFKPFAEIFKRKDLSSFSQLFAEIIAGYILKHSQRVIDLELFICSHAAQNDPTFYDYVIHLLYAQLIRNIEQDNFHEIEEAFVRFIDFDPQITMFKVLSLMKASFIELTNVFSEDADEKIGNRSFFNRIHLWSNFAFRAEGFTEAYITIIVHALRTKSLKLNPLRLKLIKILVDHDEFLAPLSSIARVLSKSRSTKTAEDADFDFENLYISSKEIGRTEKYQNEIYNRSISLLKKCMFGLRKRVAFPEIAAPIVRSIEMMLTEEQYKPHAQQLNQLKDAIKENATWIEKTRMKVVQTTEFNIIENIELEGNAPFKLK